ncbi:serine/threonine-protein kinase GA29083 isoform X3 [Anabrus simplex]|uniref:serine/threonine-protein kinase GA29083 isoform X3 n=1 Tax=Anabrus simplex TaxID=316456 RepID=UPI0034DCD651
MTSVAVEEQGSRSGSSASTFSSSLPGDENLNGRLVDFNSRHCSVVRTPQARKAKRIRFYRNGDRFYKGVTVAVTPERYRSFDSLVTDLTRALVDNVNLPSGVRNLFDMDGRKVCCLEDLEDGKCYVCSGLGESFKKVDYAGTQNQNNKIKPPRKSVSSAQSPDSPRPPIIRSCAPDYVHPRLITVIRNGTKPRKVVRLLINKRNALSFDHALSSITEAVKLDTGAVRKVFTVDGSQVNQLQDFFGNIDIFFAYGSERHFKEDFELDAEETKAIQAQCKGPSSRRLPWDSCSSLRTSSSQDGSRIPMPKMPVKTKIPKGTRLPTPQDSSPAVPPPLKLKYQVGPVIGDGNFAVVRHCIDRSTGIEYALKIIDKSKCSGKEHMIESEVAILRRVRHPNIIRLIEEHDSPTELYLVMELIKGGDLFDAIAAATKFSEKEASIMIRNLTSALFYLHNLQIVHRDIKPENLLVEVDPLGTKLLKLADFGLAQKVTEPLYTVCGTPTYVAPEILAESGYGLKIDVWAAGVILYILLCGFPPFVSATNDQEELFDRILCGHYEFSSPYWDDISHSAKDLITHMLQVQPELRFSSEDVLDHIWLAEAGGAEQLKVHRTTELQFSNHQNNEKSSDVALSAVSRLFCWALSAVANTIP